MMYLDLPCQAGCCLFRRGGVDAETDPVELCCILVHTARASGETALATLLAAWLHWFGRLELQQALQVRDCCCVACPSLACVAKASRLVKLLAWSCRSLRRLAGRQTLHLCQDCMCIT